MCIPLLFFSLSQNFPQEILDSFAIFLSRIPLSVSNLFGCCDPHYRMWSDANLFSWTMPWQISTLHFLQIQTFYPLLYSVSRTHNLHAFLHVLRPLFLFFHSILLQIQGIPYLVLILLPLAHYYNTPFLPLNILSVEHMLIPGRRQGERSRANDSNRLFEPKKN